MTRTCENCGAEIESYKCKPIRLSANLPLFGTLELLLAAFLILLVIFENYEASLEALMLWGGIASAAVGCITLALGRLERTIFLMIRWHRESMRETDQPAASSTAR